MRIYDYMKGILGAMGVGEDVGVPEPSWRIEEYLKAIYDKLKEGGGGGGSSLPSVTSSDNGKVLGVVDGDWAATKSVYIIETSGNTSPLSGSEISAIAENGMLPVLHYSSSYWIYSANNGSTAFFAKYIYSPLSQKYVARYAFVNSSKGINVGLSQNLYILPSTGIPETDLAQAVKDKLNKFIVTLTPTSPDYSGTMDKTVAQITEAYEAGMEIVFKLQTGASTYIEVPIQIVGHNTTLTYPSFETSVVEHVGNVQVFAYTGVTDDGTKQTYSTAVYTLTPAS